ncbi:MAG TPA: alkyl sulfatase C-terminal domain-containing protein [Acidimicrobiales bacterium]|nr:alkyl sulfatase C-terminal domain-containing protein [Acidimicrobiales bacterium]
MFDGTRADLDGISIRCVVEDPAASAHGFLLSVQNGSLGVLEAEADHPEPAATVSGPLSAWMDLLVHAAAGNPTSQDDLTVSGDARIFDALVHALH